MRLKHNKKKNIFQCINCNNLFHSKCINLIISDECPLCRYVYNTNMNYTFITMNNENYNLKHYINQWIHKSCIYNNHHIDFIHCSSNLRASNYRITLIDKYNTKIKAGKIVPAVATTTSIISGLVTVEIIKYVLGITNIESFKNYYLNLSLSLVTNSEPFGRSVMKIKDKDFDIWDYYNQDKDILVSELLNNVSQYYCYEIDTLIFRATLLISPMTLGNEKDKRMNMKISELLKYFNIDEIEEYEFQIDSLDTEDEVNFPNIKFIANI